MSNIHPAEGLELRASAMPMAFLCAGSVRRGAVALNEASDPASVGTATHEVLRPLAETGSLDWESIPGISERHGVDPDEVRMLAAIGAKLWPQIAPSFPGALTEVDLAVELDGGVMLTGHVDFLSIVGRVARGGDWKSGRKDADYGAQMRAYCTLILLDNPDIDEATLTVVWLRDSEIENYTMTRHQAEIWAASLVERVVRWDGVYRPGVHCQYCRRAHECEAANALERRYVAAISDQDLVARAESSLATMHPSEVIDLLAKARLVQSYASRVVDAVKAHVQRDGDIVAEGQRLTIDREERRSLNTLPAWPVLEAAGFDDEDFAAVVDVRISKVEKRAAQKAGRGKGAAAVRALDAKLRAAGAVETKEIEKLVVKRA